MEEYFEDEDMFEIDSYESELEEEDQGWSDEEAADKAPPWPGDTNPSHESESDVESESPGYTSNTTYQSWYQEEEETYEERMDRKTPDCYRSCSNTLWCEEDSEEDSHEKYNPPKRTEKPVSYGVVSYRVPAQPRPTGPRKQVNKRSGYMSNSLVFSGSSKNPEVYLRWESNMKQWLCANNIPKDKKLSYAVNALVGDAYAWWLKEDTHTFRPVFDWGDLKARMYREFVKKNQTRSHISLKPIQHMTPRIVMTTPRLHTAPPEQHNTQRCPQVATHTPSSTPNRELQEKPESKTSIALKSSAPVCYRCHKRGHFAATCPERQVVNVTTLEPKQSSSNSSDCLVQSGFEISNSSIMCLSSPRVNDVALDQVMEHTVRKVGPEKDEVAPSFILMQEEPPDHTFTQYDVASKETKLIESFGQVSASLLQLISDDSKSVMADLLSLEELDENVGAPRKLLIQNNCFTTQLKPEQKFILNKPCLPVYNNSITVLIHLIFAKRVGNIAGTKEEPADLEIQDHVRGRVEPMIPPPIRKNGVVPIFQFKDEPPDAPRNNKPSPLLMFKPHYKNQRGHQKDKQKNLAGHHQFIGVLKDLHQTLYRGWTPEILVRARDIELVHTKLSISVPKAHSLHNTDIICLSLSKVSSPDFRKSLKHTTRAKTGIGDKGFKQHVMDQQQPQGVSCFKMIKDKPLDRTPLPCTVLHTEQKRDHTQVSNTLISFISNDSKSVITDLVSLEKLDKNIGVSMKNLVQNKWFSTQVKPEQNSILNQPCVPVYNNSMAVITHLFLAKGVDNRAGIKEEPPDAPFIHRTPTHRGKVLNYQRRMKANLLSLGADYQVSRSKHCQEGGYDEAIKSNLNPDHVPSVKEAPKTYYKGKMKAILSLGTATDSTKTKKTFAYSPRNKISSSCQLYTAALNLLCLSFRLRRAQRLSLENHVWRPGAVSSPLPWAEDTQRRAKELYSFSLSRFYPIGFSEKGFNEATPLVRIPELATTSVHPYKLKNALASAALHEISFPPRLSIFEHFSIFFIKLHFL